MISPFLASWHGFGYSMCGLCSAALVCVEQLPTASPEAVDLIASLCHWNPAMRPNAAEALLHPFFQASPVRLITM